MPVTRTSGQGRPKGIPNKATMAAREAIAQFVDGNAHRLTEWLDRVADENPAEAFKLFQSVVEYHIPKLARVEQNIDVHHTIEDALTELFKGGSGTEK